MRSFTIRKNQWTVSFEWFAMEKSKPSMEAISGLQQIQFAFMETTPHLWHLRKNYGPVLSTAEFRFNEWGVHMSKTVIEVLKSGLATTIQDLGRPGYQRFGIVVRSEEQTSELQSRFDLVCRLLLENKTRTKR